MAAKAYNGKWWGAGKVCATKREADLADPTYYAGKYYLNGQTICICLVKNVLVFL